MLVAIPIPSSLLFTPPPRTYMLSTPLPPPPSEYAPRSLTLMPLAKHPLDPPIPPPPAPNLGTRVHRASLVPAPLPLASLRAAVVHPAVRGRDAALPRVAEARAVRGRAHAVPVAVAGARAGLAAPGAEGGAVGARAGVCGAVGALRGSGVAAGGEGAAVGWAVAGVGFGFLVVSAGLVAVFGCAVVFWVLVRLGRRGGRMWERRGGRRGGRGMEEQGASWGDVRS